MAYRDTNETQEQPKAAQAGQAQAQGAAAGGAPSTPWGWNQQVGYGMLMSRNVGSESLAKLKELLSEVYQSGRTTGAPFDIGLLELDNAIFGNRFSCLIVTGRFRDQPQLGVAYHTLMLVSTGDPLEPVKITAGQNQIEEYLAPSAAFDADLKEMILALVKKAYPEGPWFPAEGEVIPKGFNYNGKEELNYLAWNASNAVYTTMLYRHPNFHDMDLKVMPKDTNLVIEMNVARTQMQDAVGNPARADVLMLFKSKAPQLQPREEVSVNAPGRDVTVTSVAGFVDFLYLPTKEAEAAKSGAFVMSTTPVVDKRLFAPRFVITDMQFKFGYTLSNILLGLYSTLALSENNNWWQIYIPTPPTDGRSVDLKDIGGLNVEANLFNDPANPTQFGPIMGTKGTNFGLPELGKFLTATINPLGLIMSIDCPVMSPTTWFTSVFSKASMGDRDAFNTIYDAAEVLTHGEFGKRFQRTDEMFVDKGNVVHMGTYNDKGQLRDLRDIDYLAICNLAGKTNPEAVVRWSEACSNPQLPLLTKLDIRRRMMEDVVNDVNITDYAHRVTLAGNFSDALVKSIDATGLAPRIATPTSSADMISQRGVADWGMKAAYAGGGFSSTGFGRQDFGSRDPRNFQTRYFR